jgi:hypothetical protein
MSTKAFAFSDTEKQTIGKTDDVKSSAARQAWKHAIDSVEESWQLRCCSIPSTFCELRTKMAIGFLSGWTFH